MSRTTKLKPELLDLRVHRDEELLQALYQELYLPNFQIQEQQEDPSVWKPLLWGPPLPPPKPILRLIVAGERLQDPSARILYGFIMPEFFRRSASGLLTYLAVHPRFRRRGIGKLLIEHAKDVLREDAREHDERLKAIFGEVNDPRKVSDISENKYGETRLTVLDQLGARYVPVEYVQPELKRGRGRSYSLLLVAFPVDSQPLRSVQSLVIRDFLYEFYQALSVTKPEVDRDFIRMMSSLMTERVAVRQLDSGQAP